ncbi:MAG: L-threonine 3-dehydrogenase [Calditrichia bacterium]
MKRVLITGALGQIGSELAVELANIVGAGNVLCTDIKPDGAIGNLPYSILDVTDSDQVNRTIREFQPDLIFHMAAILSAVGEQNPLKAFEVNLSGQLNVMEAARLMPECTVVIPSSIAAFGPDAPKENTPDDTVMNPTTMYGVTKVAGEKLCNYYYYKFGLDARSVRFPGIISSETLPGGGTTDYAVDMFIAAVKSQKYVCYIEENTPLPFLYMPDAIQSLILLAEAPEQQLSRRVYNLHGFTCTPGQLAKEIQKSVPNFTVSYDPDFRQKIAESWPHSLDDHYARKEWGWKPQFTLKNMAPQMLAAIREKYAEQGN